MTDFEARLKDKGAMSLARSVASKHRMTLRGLCHGSSFKAAWARTDVYKALRSVGFTLKDIGWMFGKHHTTVLKNLQRLARSEAETLPPPAEPS